MRHGWQEGSSKTIGVALMPVMAALAWEAPWRVLAIGRHVRDLSARFAKTLCAAARNMISAKLCAVCLVCTTPAAHGEVTALVTGDFEPFAEKQWPEQGLAVALVRAALLETAESEGFGLVWKADPADLAALMHQPTHDLAFPVTGTGCATQTSQMVCDGVLYSDPLLDVVTLVFVQADAPFAFDRDEDLAGKHLCAPDFHTAGSLGDYVEHSGAVSLSRKSLSACFDDLARGRVDGVAVIEFSGVAQLFESGLTEAVVPLSRPLSHVSLHAVAAQDHWRANVHINRVNAGLAALHQTGAYADIIERHISSFWEEVQARRR